MADVCVCTLLYGRPAYFRAGRQALLSVLARSDFDVRVVLGPSCTRALPRSPRIAPVWLRQGPASPHRAERFLLKFRALEAALAGADHEWWMWLDSDALFARRIAAEDVRAALDGRGLGMAEQTGILGSGTTRRDLVDHYARHTLAWFGASGTAAPCPATRFFNSGVVLAHRPALEKLLAWALETIEDASGDHEVGEHMIADQDYFQYWANVREPGSCTALDWSWNHCEHWDAGFPRRGARILHLSNFCNGPSRRNLLRMQLLRRAPALERTIRRLRSARAHEGRAR